MGSVLDALFPERTLDEGDRRAVADELAAYNHRVIRVLAMVAALINVGNIVIYSTLHSSNPAYQLWIDNVVRLHLVLDVVLY